MAPADAQFFWMSAKIPNDQFVLYAFAGAPAELHAAIDDVRARATACRELRLRVEDDCVLRYPRWCIGDVDETQCATYEQEIEWLDCLDRIAALADDQLDLRRAAWRLHVFTPVSGVPGSAGSATVAVLQMGHALADGTRSAALAGILFGRSGVVAAVPRVPTGCLVQRSIGAANAHKQLEHDVAAGRLPPAAPARPALSVNTRPAGARVVRTLVRARPQLAGPTVTVGVLAAISTSLSGYLGARGEDVSSLGAEVPMAKAGARHAHNHFRNVGIGLYPTVADRAALIAADLEDRRRRGDHPAFDAGDRAVAAVPAALLRWGVRQFDPAARSDTVTGNTVVSSVNRGAADLYFGGCPVVLTAGYPALSPMMGLTHGIHGIGDTIAVSVHTAQSALADIDEYLDRLNAAL